MRGSLFAVLVTLLLLSTGCSGADSIGIHSGHSLRPPAVAMDAGEAGSASHPLVIDSGVMPSDGASVMRDGASLPFDAGPSNGSLLGTEVTFTVHCCWAPVGDDNLKSSVATATIGPSVEFPHIRRIGSTVIDADVDVGRNYVRIAYREDFTAYAGTFDGYEFDFATVDGGANIVGVAASPESTAPDGAVTPTWNADKNRLLVDVAGLEGTTATVVVVRLDVR